MPTKREPVTIDGNTGRVIRSSEPERAMPQPAPANVRVFARRVDPKFSPAFRADVLAARIVEGAAGEVEREVKRAVRRFFRGR